MTTYAEIESAVMPVYWAIYNNIGTYQSSKWMDEAVLTSPQMRLSYSAHLLGFDLNHIPCPINVKSALRGEETVVGYTADWRQRLEFLAEVGVEVCSAFVSSRDLYMGVLAAAPAQRERYCDMRRDSDGWQHHINYNGAEWSFSEPR